MGDGRLQDTAVRTVDRVATILRVLAASEIGLQIAEIAIKTGLPKATVHRLLGALTRVGYTFQDLDTRRYRLGAGAASLGRTAIRQSVEALAQPALDRIADATQDTAFSSVREGSAAICVARAVGSFPIRTLTLEVGDRRPLGVGAGSLALLSSLADPDIDLAITHNRAWLSDFPGFGPEDLRALVARSRLHGHAYNEGRIVTAMNAVAVAVRGENGFPVAALSLAAIRDRMEPDRRPELVRILRAEADQIERALATG